MTIIAKHPYSFLFAGAGIVLLIMLLFVRNQSTPAAGYGPTISVSTDGTLINPGISSRDPLATAPQPMPSGEQGAASSTPYVPIVIGKTDPAQNTNVSVNTPSTLTLAAGNQTSATVPPSDGEQLLNYVYSLIPSGIAQPTTLNLRTPTQAALFAYGNGAGRIVATFAGAHPDMADVLKVWLADRSNAAKVAGARSIARDMQAAGAALAALPDVPSAALAANQTLSKGYSDAGTGLLEVIAAGGDDTTLVDAMKSYDATADAYTSAYISLVDMFSLYGVQFSASEPGSAFSFSGGGGL